MVKQITKNFKRRAEMAVYTEQARVKAVPVAHIVEIVK